MVAKIPAAAALWIQEAEEAESCANSVIPTSEPVTFAWRASECLRVSELLLQAICSILWCGNNTIIYRTLYKTLFQ